MTDNFVVLSEKWGVCLVHTLGLFYLVSATVIVIDQFFTFQAQKSAWCLLQVVVLNQVYAFLK